MKNWKRKETNKAQRSAGFEPSTSQSRGEWSTTWLQPRSMHYINVNILSSTVTTLGRPHHGLKLIDAYFPKTTFPTGPRDVFFRK